LNFYRYFLVYIYYSLSIIIFTKLINRVKALITPTLTRSSLYSPPSLTLLPLPLVVP